MTGLSLGMGLVSQILRAAGSVAARAFLSARGDGHILTRDGDQILTR